jgi:hypothetical protein
MGKLNTLKCDEHTPQLISLEKFCLYENHDYFIAIVKSPFGHYCSYAGTSNPYTSFVNIDNTNIASKMAEYLIVNTEQSFDYIPHGVTFSDSAVFDNIRIGEWWIGTDYSFVDWKGDEDFAKRGAMELATLLMVSTEPTATLALALIK